MSNLTRTLSSSDFPQAVYGNETYEEFSPKWDSWPVIVAVIPLFYMFPTLFVIIRVIQVYCKSLISSKSVPINQHIFLVLSLAQVMSFLYFIADYMMLRLPATGFFTAYCATVYPNQYIKLIFFLTFYFNYSAMVFPFLLCLLRLILIMFPNTHQKINSRLLAVSVPITLIYPIIFTFFLIPAVGYCRQLGGPYPFGSVSVYYSGGALGMRNSVFHFFNTVFWMAACLLVNVILFIKLRSAILAATQGTSRSSRSRKAEISLTATTVAMILPYLTYAIFIVLYLKVPAYTYYMMIIRPFGNDCETVIVPWIFYLTHPVFKNQDGSVISITVIQSSTQRKERASMMPIAKINV
ncbi:Serpentine Receptor, class U [Caenorhabditis elegans]|uniref:Serpentine Receptor, class U n=1 Tax=Caenorhabditis elegans TaxID=6239 RepID=Q21788_CAEEL|nr:Serpentine Receptor, class U [Caenorhabditis elegans]CAA96667.2 Serpentine Receptor, class U [Caenorhabditis elegans]|eukprot:NP_505541.2 Serpentine Receptor, class U [Caenorhabditis elegans]